MRTSSSGSGLSDPRILDPLSLFRVSLSGFNDPAKAESRFDGKGFSHPVLPSPDSLLHGTRLRILSYPDLESPLRFQAPPPSERVVGIGNNDTIFVLISHTLMRRF
jgi:hypothetical protein